MYIDAYHNKNKDAINLVERVSGKRVFKEIKADNHFYISDPRGSYKTIYGTTVKKVVPKNTQDKFKLLKLHGAEIWESDVNPVMRILEQNYLNCEVPEAHIAFFDIEADFCKDRGYAPPDDPFNKITSIAVYMSWMEQMVCLAIAPETLSPEEAEDIASQVEDVILCKSEEDMLEIFLDLIEDADILTAWNGDFYDIPYTVGRVDRLLGDEGLKKFCLWGRKPRAKMMDRGGKEELTYDLSGRIHLDLMELYKKYTYEERTSYALDAIAEYELEERKVQYDKTLDHLYNYDFKMFLEYNIQDTLLLYKLNKKLQHIELCNLISHSNCVLLPTSMGTVAMTDQAVVIEAHSKNLIAPNKQKHTNDTRAAGGWVANPKKGLHKWIGSSDLNSLYPSTIRALNMSPETIIGQVRLSETVSQIRKWESKPGADYTFASWWNDRFSPLEMEGFFDPEKEDQMIKLDMETGETVEMTCKDLRRLIFEGGQPWHISANGTIFRNDIEGIIPSILTRWYAERKALKAIQFAYSILDGNPKNEVYIEVPEDMILDEDVGSAKANPYDQASVFKIDKAKKLIKEGNAKRLAQYMSQHNLCLKDGRLTAKDIQENAKVVDFWDKRQHVKKINLNSAYGALLNKGSRFFDQRLGQSTTLTGRNITKHMAAQTNEFLAGEYDHSGKVCIYGDTDSVYFSVWPVIKDQVESGKMKWGIDEAITLYDGVSDKVDATFPKFMKDTFQVPLSRSNGVIAAGREIVASTGLFIKKKRYAALILDNEGKRCDVNGKPGKLKAMGLDLRRSDTPKKVQEFLSSILMDLLTDKSKEHIIGEVRTFKKDFGSLEPWQKGKPSAVNKLSHYEEVRIDNKKKKDGERQDTIPGHVLAAIHWNELRKKHNDKHIMPILNGQKVIVCNIKERKYHEWKSIAYPIDEPHLPDWFFELEFDEPLMMEKIVDKKVENLLGVLGWDLSMTDERMEHMETLFDMSVFDK